MNLQGLMAGKSVIITGASRGIGQATALVMLEAGANVVVNARKENNALEETMALLNDIGPDRVAVSLGDVTDPDYAPSMAAMTKERFGSIDVLVNNAGIIRDKPLGFMKETEWDAVLDTNLKSAFYCSKAVGRQMATQRSGRIINISSITALSGRPGQTNYGAAKAGLIGFTKSLAREMAAKNVLVNALAVGVIDTRMTKQIPRDTLREIKEMVPLGRVGHPDEVANVCLFLASDLSTYITGSTLNVSGGGYI